MDRGPTDFTNVEEISRASEAYHTFFSYFQCIFQLTDSIFSF